MTLYSLSQVWTLNGGIKVTISHRPWSVFGYGGPIVQVDDAESTLCKRKLLTVLQTIDEEREGMSPADNLRVVEGGEGLIGVIHHEPFVEVHRPANWNADSSWTSFVVNRTLVFVFDAKLGRVWMKGDGPRCSDLRLRLVQTLTGSESAVALAGIRSVEVAGGALDANTVHSFAVFPDLDYLAIYALSVTAEAIEAVNSLRTIRRMWFESVEFDSDSIDAIVNLKGLDLIVIRQVEPRSISDTRVDHLRSSLGRTKLRILEPGEYIAEGD